MSRRGVPVRSARRNGVVFRKRKHAGTGAVFQKEAIPAPEPSPKRKRPHSGAVFSHQEVLAIKPCLMGVGSAHDSAMYAHAASAPPTIGPIPGTTAYAQSGFAFTGTSVSTSRGPMSRAGLIA